MEMALLISVKLSVIEYGQMISASDFATKIPSISQTFLTRGFVASLAIT